MSSDGCLTHLGRVDHRIRIGGESIDTGEMEKQLTQYSREFRKSLFEISVDHLWRTQDSVLTWSPRLIAALTPVDLRDELSRAVGARPAPYSVVVLDALPLTKDLKIDL